MSPEQFQQQLKERAFNCWLKREAQKARARQIRGELYRIELNYNVRQLERLHEQRARDVSQKIRGYFS